MRYLKHVREPVLITDYTDWQPPAGCVGCEYPPAGMLIAWDCPVHGVVSGSPVIEENDFPPLKVVYE